MTNTIENSFGQRIQRTHHSIIKVTADLTDEQFAQQPSQTAPPIGWHLFHSARWTDRLQASLSLKSSESNQPVDLSKQIWTVESLAAEWGLPPTDLGFLETGIGMTINDAVSVALLGKSPLLDYARRTFAKAEQVIAELNVEQLQQLHPSIFPQVQVSPTGQLTVSGERNVTVLDDLLFHISHAGRHLGMIEALRGVLFTIAGTASL